MFWVFQQRSRTGTADTVESESRGGSGTASPLDVYLRFARDAANAEAVSDETLIVEGLQKLAGAIGSLNPGTLDVQVRLRVAAEHVLINSDAVATGEAVRDSLISAAEAVDMGGGGAPELRRLAGSIQPDRSLTEQRTTFLEFFRAAADALERSRPSA